MFGPEPAGSSTRAEAGRPGPGVDRRAPWQEADSSSTEAGVGRKPLEAAGLDVAQPCSIAAGRRQCMEPAVSEHNSTTFLIHLRMRPSDIANKPCACYTTDYDKLVPRAAWISQKTVHAGMYKQ